MEIKRIEGATRTLGAPKDWQEDDSGKCYGLPIRDVVTDDGLKWMVSAWEPSPEELKLLQSGVTIKLMINGISHPVVSLFVGEI